MSTRETDYIISDLRFESELTEDESVARLLQEAAEKLLQLESDKSKILTEAAEKLEIESDRTFDQAYRKTVGTQEWSHLMARGTRYLTAAEALNNYVTETYS
jgi:hypothetical protein